MIGFVKQPGRWTKLGLATIGAAVIAVPLVSAFAQVNDAIAGQAPTEVAAAPAAPLSAEQVDHAREIFNNFSCSACHTLGDAGASGQIGPSLDGDTKLDHAYIVTRVTGGQGAMPGFGGQIPDEDIALLASYILQVKK